MQHHVRCEDKDISRYVLCPGDYDRAKKIADHFSDAYLVTESRGYKVYSGHYGGVFMTSIGTGMGGPQAAIAYEELGNMGADTFIRVGSCGVFQPEDTSGDVVITTGVYRGGGTSLAYLPVEFPAVPTFSVLKELVAAGEALKYRTIVGITRGRDAFYAPPNKELVDLLVQSGMVASEMESDTLFIIGAYRGWRTGAVFVAGSPLGRPRPENAAQLVAAGEARAIEIALKAMLEIAKQDAAAK
ncbi:MAG: nucleoside phosphorylase [Anaerolineae bacterium]|nr:nucleoside phosphorylase [Anaerolineae bacterium]